MVPARWRRARRAAADRQRQGGPPRAAAHPTRRRARRAARAPRTARRSGSPRVGRWRSASTRSAVHGQLLRARRRLDPGDPRRSGRCARPASPVSVQDLLPRQTWPSWPGWSAPAPAPAEETEPTVGAVRAADRRRPQRGCRTGWSTPTDHENQAGMVFEMLSAAPAGLPERHLLPDQRPAAVLAGRAAGGRPAARGPARDPAYLVRPRPLAGRCNSSRVGRPAIGLRRPARAAARRAGGGRTRTPAGRARPRRSTSPRRRCCATVHQLGDCEWRLTHSRATRSSTAGATPRMVAMLLGCTGRCAGASGPPCRRRRRCGSPTSSPRAGSLRSATDRDFWAARPWPPTGSRLPAEWAARRGRGAGRRRRCVEVPSSADLRPALRRLSAAAGTSLKSVLHAAHLKVLGVRHRPAALLHRPGVQRPARAAARRRGVRHVPQHRAVRRRHLRRTWRAWCRPSSPARRASGRTAATRWPPCNASGATARRCCGSASRTWTSTCSTAPPIGRDGRRLQPEQRRAGRVDLPGGPAAGRPARRIGRPYLELLARTYRHVLEAMAAGRRRRPGRRPERRRPGLGGRARRQPVEPFPATARSSTTSSPGARPPRPPRWRCTGTATPRSPTGELRRPVRPARRRLGELGVRARHGRRHPPAPRESTSSSRCWPSSRPAGRTCRWIRPTRPSGSADMVRDAAPVVVLPTATWPRACRARPRRCWSPTSRTAGPGGLPAGGDGSAGTTSRTSSTRRARPGGPRASRSPTAPCSTSATPSGGPSTRGPATRCSSSPRPASTRRSGRSCGPRQRRGAGAARAGRRPRRPPPPRGRAHPHDPAAVAAGPPRPGRLPAAAGAGHRWRGVHRPSRRPVGRRVRVAARVRPHRDHRRRHHRRAAGHDTARRRSGSRWTTCVPTSSTTNCACCPRRTRGTGTSAGAGVARGYLDRPGAHRRAVRAGPVRRRAGRAHVPHRRRRSPATPTARCDFHGRGDQQVKVRGFRIELGEIEHALDGAPGGRAPRPSPSPGRHRDAALVAYYAPRAAAPPVRPSCASTFARAAAEHIVPTATWLWTRSRDAQRQGRPRRAAGARRPRPVAHVAPAWRRARRGADTRHRLAQVLGIDAGRRRRRLLRPRRALDGDDAGDRALRSRHGVRADVRGRSWNTDRRRAGRDTDGAVGGPEARPRRPATGRCCGCGAERRRRRSACTPAAAAPTGTSASSVPGPGPPVAAFEWPGPHGEHAPHGADGPRHYDELRAAQPHGPYRCSAGAAAAHRGEMAPGWWTTGRR